MTQKYYSLMTNSGIEYINSQVLINPNKIMADGWYIKLGNGETEPSADMTDLSNVIYTKTAEDYPQITFGSNNDGHYAEMLLPESLSGEIITETGLYNQNDVLIAVAKTYIDLSQTGDGLEMSVKQRIYLSAVPASVSVIYTAQADLITEDRLAEELAELSDTINNNINNVSNIKQDKLTAGTNIYLDNNSVISAIGKYLYSFNTGNINNSTGYADLIGYSGASVNYKVGGDYPNLVGTLPSGKMFSVNNILSDNVAALADGSYKKYVGSDGSAELLNNILSISKTEPSTPSDNDVWINNAVSPLSVKKYVERNYTEVGSPTISVDGIVSGFSQNDYIEETINTAVTSNNALRLKGKLTLPDTLPSATQYIFYQRQSNTNFYTLLQIRSEGIMRLYNYDTINVRTIDIAYNDFLGQTFYFDITVSNSEASFKYSLNNSDWTEKTNLTTQNWGNLSSLYLAIGVDEGQNRGFSGSFDLKEFKIFVNDTLVYQPAFPNGWVNYDKIPLGKITVSGGAVTDVQTDFYNKDYISNNVVLSNKNGSEGCILHADGYCEQWNRVNGSNSGTVNLPIAYSSTGYNIQLTPRREDNSQPISSFVVGDRTASSFGWYSTAQYTAGIDWRTTGYTKL